MKSTVSERIAGYTEAIHIKRDSELFARPVVSLS